MQLLYRVKQLPVMVEIMSLHYTTIVHSETTSVLIHYVH